MWSFNGIDNGQFHLLSSGLTPLIRTVPFRGNGAGLGLLPTPPPARPTVKRSTLLQQLDPSVLPMMQFPNPYYPNHQRNPYLQNPSCAQIEDSSSRRPFADLFRILLEEKQWNPNKHPHLQLFETLPLNDQLHCFLTSQLLTAEQIRIRWQLAIDVLCLLRLYYPECQAYVFGSLLTGLGDSSSDVDLYVDLCNDDGLCFQLRPASVQAIRNARDHLQMVIWRSSAIHARGPFADEITPIGKQIPYLRLTHHLTHLKCDISVGSRIPVQNSELLRFYVKYDPRVLPFMIILRYWASFHEIAGESQIKHYALSLLGIVYLTRISILPSIYLLQVLAAKEREKKGWGDNPDDIENWDTSFCQNIPLIAQHFSTRLPITAPEFSAKGGQIILELVEGFFEMITKWDLSSVVISPLIGNVISKKVFLARNEADLPEPFMRAFPSLHTFDHDRPLCLQDPFVLNFNVGRAVRICVVEKFKKACLVTLQNLRTKRGRQSFLNLFVSLTPPNNQNSSDGSTNRSLAPGTGR